MRQALTVALLVLAAGDRGWAQSAGRGALATSTGGATMMLSPSVVATWFTARLGDQPEDLQLLVLWRGSVGWFLRPGGSSVRSGGGAFDSRGPETRVYHETIVQGGVTLTLDFDPQARKATVHGTTLDLGDDNVVLVDEVDSPAGPRVAGRMRIPRAMPGSAGQIGPVLKKSPRIITFLQCDATPPDAPGKTMLEGLCLQNIGILPK